MSKAIDILVSSNNGIYIPLHFSQIIMAELSNAVEGWEYDSVSAEIVARGPDCEEYWEAWAQLLDTTVYRQDGKVWRLHLDGDLFSYCQEAMTESEKADWRDIVGYGNEDTLLA
jgi:hypothetical protein